MTEDFNPSIGGDGEIPAATDEQFVSTDFYAIDGVRVGAPGPNYTSPDGREIRVDPAGNEVPAGSYPRPGEFGGPPGIGPETHTEAEHEAGRQAQEEREERMEWLHHTHDPHTEEEPEFGRKPGYNPEIPNNEPPPY
jgi:hypothetical protein